MQGKNVKPGQVAIPEVVKYAQPCCQTQVLLVAGWRSWAVRCSTPVQVWKAHPTYLKWLCNRSIDCTSASRVKAPRRSYFVTKDSKVADAPVPRATPRVGQA